MIGPNKKHFKLCRLVDWSAFDVINATSCVVHPCNQIFHPNIPTNIPPTLSTVAQAQYNKHDVISKAI